MLGVQISHEQCTSVLLSVPAPTTTHTREGEIKQIYESVHLATSFYKQKSFKKRFKERYVKHSVEIGSSALE